MKSKITIDHDRDKVSIHTLTNYKEESLDIACKDTVNTREILVRIFNYIDFLGEEPVELGEIIDGEYVTLGKW